MSTDGIGEMSTFSIPPSQIVYVKLLMFGECKCTISVPEKITREDFRKRASQEFRGRVDIQPETIPEKEGSTVICYPTYVPEVAKGEPQIPTVTPHLEREQKLYPVEVPACATFDDMVIVASNIMGCPCMLRTDTRFPLRTDDHILIAAEQGIHLEQMRLEALRAEDELKNQQRMNAIQWTMADLPPRPASRELPSIERAFNYPHQNRYPNGERKLKLDLRISAEHKAHTRRDTYMREEKAHVGTKQPQTHLGFQCKSLTPERKLKQAMTSY
jgi:hypothetical protein